MKNEAPICTWPSCKCTARDQCLGLGVRAPSPAPEITEEMVERAIEAALPELQRREALMADAITLDRMQAQRIVRAALTALAPHRRRQMAEITDDMVERGARALALDHARGTCRTLDQVHEHVETKWGRYEREARSVLEAALATQEGRDGR